VGKNFSSSLAFNWENIMYRLGWPLATLLATMGVPLLIQVEIIHDNEANVYIATSPDLKGLVVEGETLDELEKEVWRLVPELLSLDRPKLLSKSATHLSFIQPPIAV
jgi:predicted RNase H-like HicB family nuclease